MNPIIAPRQITSFHPFGSPDSPGEYSTPRQSSSALSPRSLQKPAFHPSPLPRLDCKTDQTPPLGGSRFFIQDPVTHSIPIGGCREAV